MAQTIATVGTLLAQLGKTTREQAILYQCDRYDTRFVTEGGTEHSLTEFGQPGTYVHGVEYSYGAVGENFVEYNISTCPCDYGSHEEGECAREWVRSWSEVEEEFKQALLAYKDTIVKVVSGTGYGGRKLEGSRIYGPEWEFVLHRKLAIVPITNALQLPWVEIPY